MSMKMKMVPTIGRIVLAHHKENWGGALPGIVTGVQSLGEDEYQVDVRVFDARSGDKALKSAPLLDPLPDGSVLPDAPFWCEWMPYQKGQAAMTEKIAKSAWLPV